MTEEIKNEAPVAEDKATQQAEKPEQKAVGEILKTETKKDEPRTVPEAKFLEIKKELKELKQQIAEGASKKEIAGDLKDLASKYDVNEDFLSELTAIVKTKTEAEFDNKLDSTLKPYREKEKESQINDAFEKHFNAAMESMEEYNGIVNKEVIKALSLDPKNSSKTFSQLIEDAYGQSIKGKRSIEASHQGNNRSQDVDIAKASKDGEYFKQMIKDEASKKEYNKGLISRLSSSL